MKVEVRRTSISFSLKEVISQNNWHFYSFLIAGGGGFRPIILEKMISS